MSDTDDYTGKPFTDNEPDATPKPREEWTPYKDAGAYFRLNGESLEVIPMDLNGLMEASDPIEVDFPNLDPEDATRCRKIEAELRAHRSPKPREGKASKRIPELKTLISKQLISIDNGAAFTLDDNGKINTDIVTCYACGMSWNDALITERTPTPSGRCPYEHIHSELEELKRLTHRSNNHWFPVQLYPVPPTAIEPRALSAALPTLHLPHDPRR